MDLAHVYIHLLRSKADIRKKFVLLLNTFEHRIPLFSQGKIPPARCGRPTFHLRNAIVRVVVAAVERAAVCRFLPSRWGILRLHKFTLGRDQASLSGLFPSYTKFRLREFSSGWDPQCLFLLNQFYLINKLCVGPNDVSFTCPPNLTLWSIPHVSEQSLFLSFCKAVLTSYLPRGLFPIFPWKM